MIKVISVPKAPKHAKHQYRITCGRCGTVFECDDTDFHTEIVGHGDSDDLVYCPTCNDSCSQRLSPYFCKVELIGEDNEGYISPRDGKYYHYVR